MSFTRKRLDVTIQLGAGQFGEQVGNTVTLTGLRVQASIQILGGDAMPAAQLRIYGLPLQMVNQLTAIGPINSSVLYRNSLLLAAGDDENGMQTVYNGSIWQAWGEFEGAPETPLNVMCLGGLASALKPVGALSFPGAADVATIMQGLAQTMGLAFENNGVQVSLSNPYFPGTAMQQVRACARAANIYFSIDRGTLAIWPKTGFRTPKGTIPLISPATGMRGYPRFTSQGIEVSCEWNPSVQIGGKIQVQSSLPVACGEWIVLQATHTLESEMPDGAWFTTVQGVPLYGAGN